MKQLPSLNGLRAISIIIVILFHLFRFNLSIDGEYIFRIPIFNGRFGVNVFFVISGFLITSLLLQEEGSCGSISIRDFYLRRVLRIFPAYFFLLLVYFLLQCLGYIYISRPAWLTALTYTKYINYNKEFYTSHAWSLSIEENFYLFWPLIFIAGDKVRKDVTTYLILIVPLVRLFFFYYPTEWAGEQSLFTRIDSIAMGCFIALNKEKILERLSPYWGRAFYISLIVIFIVPWIPFLFDRTYLHLFFILFGDLTGTIANIAIGVIMLYSVYGPRGKWFKILNSTVFSFVGILSYSLYLWQQFFLDRSPWAINRFPQNILLIFIAAMFSYYVIERPFLKLKKKFSGKKTSNKSAGQPVTSF